MACGSRCRRSGEDGARGGDHGSPRCVCWAWEASDRGYARVTCLRRVPGSAGVGARGRIGPGGPTGLQNQLGSVRTLVGSIPTRSRQGPPVIFIPGLGNTVHVYAGFAGRFTARHPVVAVTTWGFGASLPNDRGAPLDTIRSRTAPATTCRIGIA